MKKKFLALASLAAIVAPIATVISCSSAAEKHDRRVKIILNRVAEESGPNKWVDDSINSRADAEWSKKVSTSASSALYGWGDNFADAAANAIKGVVNPNLYSLAEVKSDFAYLQKDHSVEIHNLITNFFLWSDSDVLGFMPRGIIDTGNFTGPKTTVIESPGGPKGMIDKDYDQSTLFLHSKWTSDYDLTSTTTSTKYVGMNVLPIIFNQAQYSFVPSKFLQTLPAVQKNAIITKAENSVNTLITKYTNEKAAATALPTTDATRAEKIKKAENYIKLYTDFLARYHAQVIGTELSEYVALKYLMGNLNLMPSEVFEVSSAAFTEINAVRKETLIDKEKALNHDVVLEGSSFGYEEIESSIMVNPNLLYKSKGVMVALNYLHKYIKGSLASSGGIKTELDDQSYTGNPGTVDTTLYYGARYNKMKYGLLEPLKEVFKTDNKFKTEFVNKTNVYIGSKDWNVGSISDIERRFFEENKVKYVEKPYGHDTRVFPDNAEYIKDVLKINDANFYSTVIPWFKVEVKEKTS